MDQTVVDTYCYTFCDRILPEVSRSFALIIPKCPPPLNRALCVSYLICRIADTIEDRTSLDIHQRELLYDALLHAIDKPEDRSRAEDFIKAWPAVPDGTYGQLVNGICDVLSAFNRLPNELRQPIKICVHDMVLGMRDTHAVEKRNDIAFMCADLDELDQYCHHVAGNVGIMATSFFESRFDPTVFSPTDQWREDGRLMGLGLQMTNIIKDCHVDARRGVSFIPSCYVDFSQSDYRLLRWSRAELIKHTIGHLDSAMRYIQAVPSSEIGIRTFLLGSVLPAIATLELAASGKDDHPKLDRTQMAAIFKCIEHHHNDSKVHLAWYEEHRRRTLDIADS
ncbi:MAG: squalene/phytoene synthase family protein [Planctomycetota bacterium]|nr:MAG: squalene/phytoene synthase family protein [Planctomycetota bacterium]